ncbi:MAG TPA: Dabb family protein [Pirellulaceae bacterium]|nr:Dabb family protein [Pirellulaceae bacterium]
MSAPRSTEKLAAALALAALGIMTATLSSLAAEPALKPGTRIVFLGDSITQAGAGPAGYVTLVREALAKSHPDLKAEIIGAGISGNKVPDLEKRLDKDVLAKKPSLVVIYIGINDVWHSQNGRGTPKDVYEAGLKSLIQRITQGGARVLLCTPSVIGEKTDGSNQLDGMLDEYCDISRSVAKETNTPLLDLRKAFLSHLKEHNAAAAEKGILTTDGVHLNPAGNQFVAAQVLAALGAAPQEKSGMLRHIVLFKFKDDATPEQVKKVEDAFRQLPKRIDTIKDFEWGTDNSPEMLAQGFTHCFVVTFADEQGRAAYLPHAAHKEFVEILKPHLDKVLVIDYFAKD